MPRERGVVQARLLVARFSAARDGCRPGMVIFGALRSRGVRNNVTKARKLRDLMARPGPIVIIGAHNGLSGKIGEEAGFDGLWASGLRDLARATRVPDANILTMAENLARRQDDERRHRAPRRRRLRQRLRQRDQRHPLRRGVRARRHRGHLHRGQHLPEAVQLLRRASSASSSSVEEHAGKIRAAKATQRDQRLRGHRPHRGAHRRLGHGRGAQARPRLRRRRRRHGAHPLEEQVARRGARLRQAVGPAQDAARLRADHLQDDQGGDAPRGRLQARSSSRTTRCARRSRR